MKAASNYQNRLYNQFHSVRLVGFPMFSECGKYTFEVE